MRKVAAFALMAGLVIVISQGAYAQRGMMGRGTPGGPALLANKSVQEEIKLTDEQKEKLKDTMAKLNPFGGGGGGGKGFGKADFSKFKDMTEEERKEFFTKMMEKQKEATDEAMKEIKKVLKEDQYKRFVQIDLQQKGLAAFEEELVIKELKLSDEQKEKIKGISEDITKDMREIQGAMFKKEMDFAEAGKKMAAIRKESMEKATEVLKDDQKKTLQTLMGEPFEMKMDAPRGFKKKDD